jgi:ribose transport system substrate-binding protein
MMLVLALAGAIAALAVAGCGSADDDGAGSAGAAGGGSAADPGVAEAKKLLTQQEAPVPWQQPGPAVDGSVAKDKLIEYLELTMSIPFDVNIIKGFDDAAAAVGAKTFTFDAKSQASEFGRGVQQGIDRKADFIFIRSILPTLVKPQIEAAEKAGIPVGEGGGVDVGPMPDDWPKNVRFNATHCFKCAGKMMADFTIAHSDGKANVLIINPPDVPYIAEATVKGITEEFDRLCKTCKYQTVDEPVARWKDIFTLVQSVLRKNPKIDYVIPIYDAMALFAVPGIHAAGAQDRVKVVTFNGTPAVMEMLKKRDVVVADVGSAAESQGWGDFDQVLRVLSGQPPVDDIKVAMRTFDESNIDSIDLKAPESSWYDGTEDYKQKYKELWGVK